MANIGYDIDGVLTDIEAFQIKYGTKYFKRAPINQNGYGIKEMFDCSEKEEYKFWGKYLFQYFLSEPLKINVRNALEKLKSEGDKLYIITSKTLPETNSFLRIIMENMLKHWLKNNKIIYDELVLCPMKNSLEAKVKACEDYKIDIIIEKNHQNIKELSKISNLIYCSNECGINIIDKNITIVSNIDQAYKEIKKIKVQKNDKKENDIITNFSFKNYAERCNLNYEEKRTYYKNLKEYYLNLPFDKDWMEETENNYKAVSNIGSFIFDLNQKYEVINKNLLPKSSGAIYVANHVSALDPPLLMRLLENKTPHLLVKKEFLKEKAIGKLLSEIGNVFVDRANNNSQKESKDMLIKILLNGGDVIMFPEGTRNRTHKYLLDFKLGATSIAQITGAPIVPFAINWDFKGKKNNAIVKVGDSIHIGIEDNLIEKNRELRDSIASMLWENIEYENEKRLKYKQAKY